MGILPETINLIDSSLYSELYFIVLYDTNIDILVFM